MFIASCSRDCVGALSWMLDVRGDGACLVQNQLPTVRAALRPHYTNISLALRLQLRLLAARKQTSDTTPPLASVLMTLARLYESSEEPHSTPPVATAGGPRRRAPRQLPAGPHKTALDERASRTATKRARAAPRRHRVLHGFIQAHLSASREQRLTRPPDRAATTKGQRAAPPPCRAPSPRSSPTSSPRCSS